MRGMRNEMSQQQEVELQNYCQQNLKIIRFLICNHKELPINSKRANNS